jgi:hypothetical protein
MTATIAGDKTDHAERGAAMPPGSTRQALVQDGLGDR